MRSLLVTSFTPALGSGRALRTYAVVAALARQGPVDVVFQRFGADAPDPAYEALEGVTLHGVDASRGPARAAAVARARLAGAPDGFARAASPELLAAVRRRADGAGRIVADGPTAAAGVLPLARRRPVVYLAHNLESGFRHTPQLERFERRLLETFAETWMATPADVAGGRKLAPRAAPTLRAVPNAVDVAAIEPARETPPGCRVLLVADYTYAPNREGLDWLAREVWPLVRDGEPRATLAIAGKGLERPPRGQGIDVLGFVDDLGATYRSARVVAVPMLHGGGSPLKLVEALAYGVPVVATAHAAGLLDGVVPGEHVLAGEDAAGFAAAVVGVLRGEAPGLAQAGRALAERRYSIEAVAEAIAR